jgi:DNA-binding MarR family transcriptional regulator
MVFLATYACVGTNPDAGTVVWLASSPATRPPAGLALQPSRWRSPWSPLRSKYAGYPPQIPQEPVMSRAAAAPAPTRRPGRRARHGRGAVAGAGASVRRNSDAAATLDALRRIVRALRVAAGRTEEQTGLSAAQLFVLQQVAARPGLSLSELAERTHTDRTSVAAVVERLTARRLVARRPGARDRRRAEIFAAPAARPLLARAPHPPTRRLLDGVAAMNDRDLRRLALGLAALADAMGLDGGPAPMLFDDREPAVRVSGSGTSRRRAAPATRG